MLKLTEIRLDSKYDSAGLKRVAAEVLGVAEAEIKELRVKKLSIDARRKPDVRFVYTLLVSFGDDEKRPPVFRRNVSEYVAPERYVFHLPPGLCRDMSPVIVGTGPAGLFAALCLAEIGLKCIILERGQPVDRRISDVNRFWSGGGFDASSNVQFGEGGAGTFSDGKLTTGISDKRIRFVLEQLVRFGAPDDILYLSKPHIGTDNLRRIVKSMRKHLTELGCDFRFGHRLKDVTISDGALRELVVESGGATYTIASNMLILAPGNSARDTFEMLFRRGFRLKPKGFSVGVRIEHLQSDVDFAQYGDCTVLRQKLPASDYKMVSHIEHGRSVYTFCVCPGGHVVAAASELGGVVTNGMSEYSRDGENCNGALLVTVTPDDYGYGPLDGMEFQRKLEQAAFSAGGGNYHAPAQLVGDFLEKRAHSGREKDVAPTYLPGVKFCNLWDVLPEFVCESLRSALSEFSGRVGVFSNPGAVMTAVETRSSCPVRIEREDYETVNIRGIFPCGEGSGYAGGIISSAVDGVKCAEIISLRLSKHKG